MPYIIYTIIMLCAMTSFSCNAQSFLARYPHLTPGNLPEFFADWKSYTDSIEANRLKSDTLLIRLIDEAAVMSCNSNSSSNHRYKVVNKSVKVVRFPLAVDTTRLSKGEEFSLLSLSELKGAPFTIDSITLPLPDNGLYLTSDISLKLVAFIGAGCQKEANPENVAELESYIPVDYFSWTGYSRFTSLPDVIGVYCTDNLIIVSRLTGSESGDEIGFLKRGSYFIKHPTPLCRWIE